MPISIRSKLRLVSIIYWLFQYVSLFGVMYNFRHLMPEGFDSKDDILREQTLIASGNAQYSRNFSGQCSDKSLMLAMHTLCADHYDIATQVPNRYDANILLRVATIDSLPGSCVYLFKNRGGASLYDYGFVEASIVMVVVNMVTAVRYFGAHRVVSRLSERAGTLARPLYPSKEDSQNAAFIPGGYATLFLVAILAGLYFAENVQQRASVFGSACNIGARVLHNNSSLPIIDFVANAASYTEMSGSTLPIMPKYVSAMFAFTAILLPLVYGVCLTAVVQSFHDTLEANLSRREMRH